MSIVTKLDELLGNTERSKDIVEALGGQAGGSITAALDDIESITIVRKETETQEPVAKYTVSYNANGGEGSISSVEVTAGDSITLNNGMSLTPPEGKIFSGWAKSASAQSATVSSPFTPDKNTELFAVWVDE